MMKSLTQPALKLGVQAAFVAAAVGTLSFFMMRALPGDMAFRIAASRYGYDYVNDAAAQAVRSELGLDRPWWQQLASWMGDLARGRLGDSMVTGDSVWHELAHQLGHTVVLSVTAWLLAIVIGVALGVWAAVRPGLVSRAVDALSTLLRASPAFLIGVVLSLIFAVHLQWLPAAGYEEPSNIVLPAFTLAFALSAGIAQVTRAQLAQVMASDYIEFAQTKGLSSRRVLFAHAARNMAVPVLAYAGVQLVLLVEGVVVVESLFAWPGIGHALVHAVFARDVPMIQGTALALGLMFVVFNVVVDALHRWLDPRLLHNTPSLSKS
jgi:peptide/nickel transport system permease protein